MLLHRVTSNTIPSESLATRQVSISTWHEFLSYLFKMEFLISPGGFGCNANPDQNNGNAYIYTCGGDGFYHLSANCRCPTCCNATPSGTFCTWFSSSRIKSVDMGWEMWIWVSFDGQLEDCDWKFFLVSNNQARPELLILYWSKPFPSVFFNNTYILSFIKWNKLCYLST